MEPKFESLRQAYADTIIELGKKDENIVVLDADLSTSTQTAQFGKVFPERFFNVGISEQDMMGIAAGLALSGKTVFASTFAVFATGRAWDQVRQSICYNDANVKIVATHGGITVGEDGATHQSNEDIAIMRVLPRMRVIVPSDAEETRQVIRAVYKEEGPFYVRLSREKFPKLWDKNYKFEIGKYKKVKDGKDGVILAIGIEVWESLSAIKELEKEGISIALYNASSVKPIDKEKVYELAKKFGRIITIEEHQKTGGFGSAIAEFLSENYPVKMKIIGIDNIFGRSGKAWDLMKYFKLDSKAIYEIVKKFIKDNS